MEINLKELESFLEKSMGYEAIFSQLESERKGFLSDFFLENIELSKSLPKDLRCYFIMLGVNQIGQDYIFNYDREHQIEALMNLKVSLEDVLELRMNKKVFVPMYINCVPLIKSIMTEDEVYLWVKTNVLDPKLKSQFSFLDFNEEFFKYCPDFLTFEMLESILKKNIKLIKELATVRKTSISATYLINQIEHHKEKLKETKDAVVANNLVLLCSKHIKESDKFDILRNYLISKTNKNNIQNNDFNHSFSILSDIINSFSASTWRLSWKKIINENIKIENEWKEINLKKLYTSELKESLKADSEMITEKEMTIFLRKLGFNLSEYMEDRFEGEVFAKNKRELFYRMEIQEENEIEIKKELTLKIKELKSRETNKYFSIISPVFKIRMLYDLPSMFLISYNGLEIDTSSELARLFLVDYINFSDDNLEINNDIYDLLLLNYQL